MTLTGHWPSTPATPGLWATAPRQALGDLDGAVADFDRAIGINPKQARAYFGRAALLHARGNLDGAAADYDTVLRLLPRPAAVVYHLRAGVCVSHTST
jgi:tetratricopeptide (TPR) repeat protein